MDLRCARFAVRPGGEVDIEAEVEAEVEVDNEVDVDLGRSRKSVELIVLEGAAEPGERPKLTVEQFLALRRPRPPDVAPVSLDDMEQAIAERAARGAGV